MYSRSLNTNDSRFCRFHVAAVLACMVMMAGCKQRLNQSDAAVDKSSTNSAEPANGPSEKNSRFNDNKNSTAYTDVSGVNRPQPEIDEMMRLAAGPLAEQVPSGLSYLNGHLGSKEHTLRIMALKSETRRWYFLSRTVALIDDEQLKRASALIESYDVIYQDLCDRRARILETEHDGDRVRELLKYNKVAVILTGVEIRQQIIREVLNPEQRKQYAAQFEKPENTALTPDTPKSNSVTDNNKSK